MEKYSNRPLLSRSDKDDIANIIETLAVRVPDYADAAGFVCKYYIEGSFSTHSDLMSNDEIERLMSACQTSANGGNYLGTHGYMMLHFKATIEDTRNKTTHVQKALMWAEMVKTLYPDTAEGIDLQINKMSKIVAISQDDRQAAHEMFLECQRKGYLNCAE